MLQSYWITIINSFLTVLSRQYLILPIQTAMLKLLPLAPSIESFKKSGDHYKNVHKSETVWATN